MAVRRWWRLWKRPGQSREQRRRYRYQVPTEVKHRSPYSCPIPALSSTISSRNHQHISLPLRPPVSPSFLLLLVRRRVSTFLSKSSHVPYVSFTIAEALSACFLQLCRLSHGNSFSLFLPAYLSTRTSFSSFSIYSSADLSLGFFLSRFTFAFFPLHRPLTSCANVPKSIYDITARSRATSSPTDSTKAGAFYLVFYFPLPLPRNIPASLTPTPLTPAQSSRQTVGYLAYRDGLSLRENFFSPTLDLENFLIAVSRLRKRNIRMFS